MDHSGLTLPALPFCLHGAQPCVTTADLGVCFNSALLQLLANDKGNRVTSFFPFFGSLQEKLKHENFQAGFLFSSVVFKWG